MNTNCPCGGTDHGASPWAVRMAAASHENTAFRSAVWTGSFLQLTLMHIPPCGEIGLECHPETDQFVLFQFLNMTAVYHYFAFGRLLKSGKHIKEC